LLNHPQVPNSKRIETSGVNTQSLLRPFHSHRSQHNRSRILRHGFSSAVVRRRGLLLHFDGKHAVPIEEEHAAAFGRHPHVRINWRIQEFVNRAAVKNLQLIRPAQQDAQPVFEDGEVDALVGDVRLRSDGVSPEIRGGR
jgi:hypothetical protein